MKIDIKKLVKISTYARRAGVSTQAIYKQIQEGRCNLQVVTIDETIFVMVPENKEVRS